MFCTAKIAMMIENTSARKTMNCDTVSTSEKRELASDLGRWPRRAARRRPIPRQLLRLSLVRRPWIVDAAQNTSVHQVSGRLFHLPITFFTTRHMGHFAPQL